MRAPASPPGALALALALGSLPTCTRDWSRYDRDPCADTGGAPARVYLAPGGRDDAPCTAAQPCASFARAYALARPGETVELAAGSYPAQAITADPRDDPQHASPPAPLVFRPAPGAVVEVQGIRVAGAQRLLFACLRVGEGGWVTDEGAHNVEFRNVVATRGRFLIIGSSHVTVHGGAYGGTAGFGSEVRSDAAGAPSTDVTIEGVRFQNVAPGAEPNAPASCLRLYGAASSAVRRSRFVNCAQADLFVSQVPPGATHDVVIENNFFDVPRLDDGSNGYYSLQFAGGTGAWRNVVVRYNSSTSWLAFGGRDVPWSGEGFAVVGNVAPSDGDGYTCVRAPGVTYARNVWTRGTVCNPASDRGGDARFRDERAVDLHLGAGSAAAAAGDPTNAPAVDIDGDRRPTDRAPAAGADEP